MKNTKPVIAAMLLAYCGALFAMPAQAARPKAAEDENSSVVSVSTPTPKVRMTKEKHVRKPSKKRQLGKR